MIQFIVFVTIGYLMGSICSAIIVCRMASLPDPRKEGSKNPGATNVLRLAGKKYASMVILADILKGTIPVALATYFGSSLITVGFTALAAVIGHMYPIFFEFKGGKGVATAIGAMFGLQFILGVVVSATWLIVAKFTRHSSVASLVSICLAPLYAIILIGNIEIFPPLFFIAIMVLYQHRTNITRLIDGKEPKITFKTNLIDEVMDTKNQVQLTPAEAARETAPLIEEKPKKTVKKIVAAKKPKAPAAKTTKPAKAKETTPVKKEKVPAKKAATKAKPKKST